MANQTLTESASRHAVYVQRYAGGLANKFAPFLERLRVSIAATLALTPEQQSRQQQLIREVNAIQRTIYAEYNRQLELDLRQFGASESEYEFRQLENVIDSPSYEPVIPSSNQVIAAIESTPLLFEDSDTVKLLEPFITDWEASEIQRVDNIIRTGFATGQTNAQIARRISGDNGTLDKQTRRNNKTIVRTATTHVSNVARQETLKENDDIVRGYIWLSTLDDRTSATCRSRDQQEFLWTDDYQPKPPAHPNCRSTTTPLFDERYRVEDEQAERASRGSTGPQPVGATSTYYGWLKRQSAAFQDETIGPTRGKLFRNGGLTSEEFRRLSVDDKFRPLTLEEMRDKDPEAFENAGL